MSTTIPALTRCQQGTLDRARAVLDAPSGSDTASLAKRIGALEWHLAELLALVGELTGEHE